METGLILTTKGDSFIKEVRNNLNTDTSTCFGSKIHAICRHWLGLKTLSSFIKRFSTNESKDDILQ